MSSSPEIVVNHPDLCGEGPIWDDSCSRLIWTDLSAGRVYALSPERREVRLLASCPGVCGLALNEGGSLVLGGSFGIALWSADEGIVTLLSNSKERPLRVNDLVADAQGRIYAATAYWGESGREQTGGIYLLETDGTLRPVADGLGLANGMDFSPDGRYLYFADSAERIIYRAEVDAANGALRHQRAWAHVPSGEGLPDGLAVDATGFVWSAQWYGGNVTRYDPDGRVERVLRLPVAQVASLAFGGPELRDLFITTAAEIWRSALVPAGYDYAASPPGGAVYRVRLNDVQGKPENVARVRRPAGVDSTRG